MPRDDHRLTNVAPRAMWRVMIAMFTLTIATLLAVVHFGMARTLAPGASRWALGAGLILALPALLARRHVPTDRTDAAGRGGVTRLITACSLAELPALTGALYYLLGREPWGTALLVAVSALLLWRLRPLS